MGQKDTRTILLASLACSTLLNSIATKYILLSAAFVFPLLVAICQLAVAFAASRIYLSAFPPSERAKMTSKQIILTVLPLSVIMALSTCLYNISLRWIPISLTHTVLTTIPFFSYVIGRVIRATPTASERDYLVTFAPTVVGVLSVGLFDFYNHFEGFLSALLLCVVLVFWDGAIQRLLNNKLDPVLGILYASPIAAALIFPFWWWFEWNVVFERWRAEYRGLGIIFALILCGLIFAANIITRAAATNKIVAPAFKAVAFQGALFGSSALGMAIFGNRMSLLSFIGTALATGGVWWNIQIQLDQRKRKPSELPEAVESLIYSPQASHAARRNV